MKSKRKHKEISTIRKQPINKGETMAFIICKLAVKDGRSLVHYMRSNMQWTIDEGKAFRIMSEAAAESLVESEPEAWIEEA